MILYDKGHEKKIAALKKEMGPALNQLGLSKDEQNLMVVGALEHHSFTPDMPVENLIGLALRVRGEMLNP